MCFLVVAAWSSQGEVSGLGREPSLVRVMGCPMRFVAGREGRREGGRFGKSVQLRGASAEVVAV